MRITILANGSRGDVQPYVALGLGLQTAGHQVRIAAPAPFHDFVTGRGLGYADLDADPKAILESEAGQVWLESGRNPVAFIRRLGPVLEPVLDRFLEASVRACEDAEAIIYSPFGAVAWHVGEALRAPAILASPSPMVRTSAFPNPLAPVLPLGALYNRASYLLVEQLSWQLFRERINRWRRDVLGLRPLPFAGPYQRIEEEREVILHGYSRHVVPRPRDWPDWVHVTGYWFLDRPADWSPPVDLVDFLADGPAPVYIGLGSMRGRDPGQFTEMALEALRRAGRRGVLLGGWAGLGRADLPDDVFLVEDIPHDWLFPRVAAVAHHGGAGTTGAGLRAGKPSILLPFFADQSFWGWRVEALGVGPKPVPQKRLTAERLTAAIRAATTDALMRERAGKLGGLIRAEDGVACAVAILNRRLAAGW